MDKHIKTFCLLRNHRKLAERRDPSFFRNKTAKIILGIGILTTVIYLIFLSIGCAIIANSSKTMTTVGILCLIVPFTFIIDFFARFLFQESPAHIVKPYLLLPVKRQACIDNLIISSLFSSGSIIWSAFYIPYLLMSVVYSYPVTTTLYIILTLWIVTMISNQFYAIVRTLIYSRLVWWCVPTTLFALILSPILIYGVKGLPVIASKCAYIGSLFEQGSILPVVTASLMLLIIIHINRKVQAAGVIRELSNTTSSYTKDVKESRAFSNRGATWLYLQLEIKSLTRNSIVRKSFLYATFLSVFFIIIVNVTDWYDGATFLSFWALYIMVTNASILLSKMMGYEGNYMECLIIHKENILALLKAKYILFCLIAIGMYLLMLPFTLTGKWSVAMLTSDVLFTCGFQHFILFQIGVYNKQTIKLNEKLTRKGGIESNHISLIMILCCMVIPMTLINIMQRIINENIVYIIVSITGVLFILLHNIWLNNIFKRMMKRKYENLEGFRATR